jgi:hypothetical protein
MPPGKVWSDKPKRRCQEKTVLLPSGRAASRRHSNVRQPESLNYLNSAHVDFRRGETILAERQRIKREMLKGRRLQHHLQAA